MDYFLPHLLGLFSVPAPPLRSRERRGFFSLTERRGFQRNLFSNRYLQRNFPWLEFGPLLSASLLGRPVEDEAYNGLARWRTVAQRGHLRGLLTAKEFGHAFAAVPGGVAVGLVA